MTSEDYDVQLSHEGHDSDGEASLGKVAPRRVRIPSFECTVCEICEVRTYVNVVLSENLKSRVFICFFRVPDQSVVQTILAVPKQHELCRNAGKKNPPGRLRFCLPALPRLHSVTEYCSDKLINLLVSINSRIPHGSYCRKLKGSTRPSIFTHKNLNLDLVPLYSLD